MINPNQRPQASDILVFVRPRSPIALFFLILPVSIVVMIGVTVVSNSFPLHLLAVLAAVAGSCLFWIKTAAQQIGNVTIEMSAQTLIVRGLTGSQSYAWTDIEAIRLFDPGSTLADSRNHEGGRVGIGMFLRTKDQNREEGAAPDVLVVTGTKDEAANVIKGCERMIAYQRKVVVGDRGGFGRSGKGFRRQSKAA